MRKVILHFAITLDGIVSGVEKWGTISNEILEDSIADLDTLDTIVFGRNSYPTLADYWQQAETESKLPAERRFAKKLNQIHKYVLSHRGVELTWQNSELLNVGNSDAFKQAILSLKNAPGKEIWVDAGEGAWRAFLASDLWDGLDILVHPVILGVGKPLFDTFPSKIPLKMISSRTYANGVLNLRYERG